MGEFHVGGDCLVSILWSLFYSIYNDLIIGECIRIVFKSSTKKFGPSQVNEFFKKLVSLSVDI